MMSAGADCDNTLSDNPTSLALDQFINFLEPQPEIRDPKSGVVISPARAGALCQSAEDWNSMKTELEQACKILGNQCTYEMKQKFYAAVARLKALQGRMSFGKFGVSSESSSVR